MPAPYNLAHKCCPAWLCVLAPRGVTGAAGHGLCLIFPFLSSQPQASGRCPMNVGGRASPWASLQAHNAPVFFTKGHENGSRPEICSWEPQLEAQQFPLPSATQPKPASLTRKRPHHVHSGSGWRPRGPGFTPVLHIPSFKDLSKSTGPMALDPSLQTDPFPALERDMIMPVSTLRVSFFS